jgi:2-amino-4-hydroxy-6-hydroxymethyldihydropteridine diphosphokinase
MIQEENLIVPHPYAHERGFVLKPLSDIAIRLLPPDLNKTVGEMLRDLGNKMR